MNPNPSSEGGARYLRLTIIGLEFSSPILAGLIGGYYLGEALHRPWIGLVGLVTGVFVGFFRLIWEVRQIMKASE